MINFLTSPLPSSLSVCGKDYPINTDFKVWIQIENIVSDKGLSSADKLIKIFSLAFISPDIPPSIDKAIDALCNFFAPFAHRKGGGGDSITPTFSFSYDGGLIYAAFLSQYGIDLSSARLHWWRFLALFYGLDNCKFTEVVKIRSTDLSAVKDPDQKRFIRNLKRLYKIPNSSLDISSEISKIF